jgi:hypothetical protein
MANLPASMYCLYNGHKLLQQFAIPEPKHIAEKFGMYAVEGLEF